MTQLALAWPPRLLGDVWPSSYSSFRVNWCVDGDKLILAQHQRPAPRTVAPPATPYFHRFWDGERTWSGFVGLPAGLNFISKFLLTPELTTFSFPLPDRSFYIRFIAYLNRSTFIYSFFLLSSFVEFFLFYNVDHLGN
jgi:hypothetical protein